MIFFQLVLLMVHPWLHDYSEWKHWHTKYDTAYAASIKKHRLDKRGVDVHFYRAVAIIESHQTERLRGGSGNAFWGLFQISKQLAKRFKTPRYKLLRAKDNIEVFSRWVKYIINHIAPKTTGIPYGLSKRDWLALLYAGHNTGPTPIRIYIKSRHRWRKIGRWMARVRNERDAKYRSSLFQLLPRLVLLSKAGTLKGGRAVVSWWSSRDRYMIRCGYVVPKRYRWKSRTMFLERFQKSKGLPVTGVWDTVTEAAMLRSCGSTHDREARKKDTAD